jgi:LysM repeat protein
MADNRRRRRNIARFFAPLALVAFGVALAMVILSFTNEQDDGGDGQRSTTESSRQTTPENAQTPRRQRRAFYRVKLNDTLGLIAEKTGVPVERLQELNPELDPQNLVVGQRVKLRE